MKPAVPFCTPKFFPPGYFPQVPPAAVQREFQQAFTDWGLPGAVRVDNGAPWGTWSDWAPPLALWLIGLGVRIHWNDPGRPQQNGTVERSQGTTQRWAEPGRCGSVAELQQTVDEADRCQRELYPFRPGQTRWSAYPGLRHSARRYRVTQEARLWRIGPVLAHLAEYVVPRRVDQKGLISIWNRNHYVGTAYARQLVWVRLDPERREWVISDEGGNQIRIRPSRELTKERIRRLDICGNK
jgi:hypothetical protein